MADIDYDAWERDATEAEVMECDVPAAPWYYSYRAVRQIDGDVERIICRFLAAVNPGQAVSRFIAGARTGWPRDAARLREVIGRLREVAQRAADLNGRNNTIAWMHGQTEVARDRDALAADNQRLRDALRDIGYCTRCDVCQRRAQRVVRDALAAPVPGGEPGKEG